MSDLEIMHAVLAQHRVLGELTGEQLDTIGRLARQLTAIPLSASA